MKNVAFLGYGRFGSALGSLFREAGLTVRARDASACVPEEVLARTMEELVRGADLVVVAVPVTEMRAAFEALASHLSAAQIVIDVGSVKCLPYSAMHDVFGDKQPWVATHPLFGPASLARAERPLRVVVCPSPGHPEAVRKVTSLFETIGCEVIFEEPQAHDRSMAFTHALAFFVAKGLLDAGAPAVAPIAPPSYQAIVRTIELVRSDAGHLFEALHLSNPFAKTARGALMGALSAVDNDLERKSGARAVGLTEQPTEAAGEALAIPDLGDRSPELRETRELIDDLDQELIDLLARRAVLSRRAAQAKAELGHGVRDPVREARLIEERRLWARERGLDPESTGEIFRAILGFSRRVQEKPVERDNKPDRRS